jgi:hypothetical protein
VEGDRDLAAGPDRGQAAGVAVGGSYTMRVIVRIRSTLRGEIPMSFAVASADLPLAPHGAFATFPPVC